MTPFDHKHLLDGIEAAIHECTTSGDAKKTAAILLETATKLAGESFVASRVRVFADAKDETQT